MITFEILEAEKHLKVILKKLNEVAEKIIKHLKKIDPLDFVKNLNDEDLKTAKL